VCSIQTGQILGGTTHVYYGTVSGITNTVGTTLKLTSGTCASWENARHIDYAFTDKNAITGNNYYRGIWLAKNLQSSRSALPDTAKLNTLCGLSR